MRLALVDSRRGLTVQAMTVASAMVPPARFRARHFDPGESLALTVTVAVLLRILSVTTSVGLTPLRTAARKLLRVASTPMRPISA